MVEEVQMTFDEALEYVKSNVEVGDILEISYNRIFAPGDVLGITEEDEETGEGLRVNLQLNGEILNQAVEIDFKEIYDELVVLNANKTYVLSFNFDSKIIDQIYFYIQKKDYDKEIPINSAQQNYLYLRKDNSYKLSIEDNQIDKVLKLSRLTKDSEIFIEGTNITLNSNNLYYKLKENYTGDVNLKVNKADAFIEILYYNPAFKKLDFKKKKFNNLTEGYYLVSIPKNINCEFITFEIKAKKNVEYSIVTGYSIPDYVYFKSIKKALN